MKIFKIFFFIFNLCLVFASWSYDLIALNHKLDALQEVIHQKSANSAILNLQQNLLESYLPSLENCITKEKKEIEQHTKEIQSLNKISDLQYGLIEKKRRLALLHQHQDHMAFCEFTLLKINNLKKKLYELNQLEYQKSLVQKDENVWQAFSKFKGPIKKRSPTYFALKKLIDISTAKHTFRLILLILSGIFILKTLGFFSFMPFKFAKNISLLYFLKTILICFVLAPVQYMLLKITFTQHDTLLLIFFQKPIVKVMFGCLLLYFYNFYKTPSWQKDILLILIHLILFYFFATLCFEINFIEIHHFPYQEIIIKKYIALFVLQPIICSVLYWSFIKTWRNQSYCQIFLLICSMFSLFIFMAGLYGYINLAVNFDFILIINVLSFLWIFILTQIKNFLIETMSNKKTYFYQKIDKIFQSQKNISILTLKFFFITFYAISVASLLFTLMTISAWSISETVLENIYNFLYTPIPLNYAKFNLINCLQSLFVICILNLINFSLSNFLSKKLFQERSSQEKTTHLFNWIGYFLTFFIVLNFLSFQLENLFLVFGGLSLGVGIGLKNILSSLISSVILFINRPFKIGDYIEIQQTRGYVKKISLLETMIETSDNNTLILPNQYIASSVIQNYTYENKSFQKVHVKFILDNYNPKNEEIIKAKILESLRKNTFIIEDTTQPIQILFSLASQTADAYRIEIIFCLNQKADIKHEITKINRQIFSQFKSIKINAHFEDVEYPFK